MKRSEERRRAPRVEERLPLTIGLPEHQVAASTRNLSSSGVYCEVHQDVPVMTKVALAINLPERQIHCEGVVVRNEMLPAASRAAARRIAIFFTRLTVRDRQAIARFVEQRLAAAPRSAGPSTAIRSTPASRPPAAHDATHHRGIQVLAWWLSLSLLPSLLGCFGPLTIARGARVKTIIGDLAAGLGGGGETYTFRWLPRQLIDCSSHLRFDGVVVDLTGRSIHVIRQHDGDHIVALQPTERAAREQRHGAERNVLKTPAKDLPTLHAVVRRYHFEPHLIMDATGVPQAVVYAPVATHVIAIPGRNSHELYLEIKRCRGQPDRMLGGSLIGSTFSGD